MTGLSVVVACRDRAPLLAGSLPAMVAALRPGDELVVVDAASSSDDVRRVAVEAGATVVRSTAPGAAAARNAGWRAARHELIAFTDDDCRPDSGWAGAVVAALSDLDLVCGRVVAEGSGHLSLLESRQPVDYTSATDPADLGHGANVALRRSALDSVGGWDERIGPGTPWPGAEDKDLVLRVLAAGGRAGYRPEPAVRHLQWRSRRQSLAAELGYGKGIGALSVIGRGPGTSTWLRRSLRTTGADLRAGYRHGVVAGLLRTCGIAWGAALARRRLR